MTKVKDFGEELASEIIEHVMQRVDGAPADIMFFSPALAGAHLLLSYAQGAEAIGETTNPLEWAIEVLKQEWPRVQEISIVELIIPDSAKH